MSKKYRSKMGQRYFAYINSSKWQKKLPFFHSFLMHRDAICPLLPANHVHHLAYWGLGWEIYILHVVPLNKYTHAIVGIFDYAPFLIKFPFNMLLRALCLFWTIAFIPLHLLKLCR